MYCDWPQLGRCCFCLPLRKGVIILACVNILLSAFFIGLLSYVVHNGGSSGFSVYSRLPSFPAELCITVYYAEIIFNVALVYGAYTKSIAYIKTYYYFALISTLATLMLQIIDVSDRFQDIDLVLETLVFMFASLSIQVYLITLVRSLMMKLETDGPHVYDNQLHQIVTADFKIDNVSSTRLPKTLNY